MSSSMLGEQDCTAEGSPSRSSPSPTAVGGSPRLLSRDDASAALRRRIRGMEEDRKCGRGVCGGSGSARVIRVPRLRLPSSSLTPRDDDNVVGSTEDVSPTCCAHSVVDDDVDTQIADEIRKACVYSPVAASSYGGHLSTVDGSDAESSDIDISSCDSEDEGVDEAGCRDQQHIRGAASTEYRRIPVARSYVDGLMSVRTSAASHSDSNIAVGVDTLSGSLRGSKGPEPRRRVHDVVDVEGCDEVSPWMHGGVGVCQDVLRKTVCVQLGREAEKAEDKLEFWQEAAQSLLANLAMVKAGAVLDHWKTRNTTLHNADIFTVSSDDATIPTSKHDPIATLKTPLSRLSESDHSDASVSADSPSSSTSRPSPNNDRRRAISSASDHVARSKF